jgi:hypothetical protein
MNKLISKLLGETHMPVDPEDEGPIPRSRLNYGKGQQQPVTPGGEDVPIRGASKPVQQVIGTKDEPATPGGDPLAGMQELTDDDLGAFIKAIDILPDGETKDSLKKQALSMMQQMEARRASRMVKAALGEMQGVGIPGWISQDIAQSTRDSLSQLHDRFVQERVDGFTHPVTGEQIAPMSREEAEARWQKAEPKFIAKLRDMANSEEGRDVLGLEPSPSRAFDPNPAPLTPRETDPAGFGAAGAVLRTRRYGV